MKSYSYTRGVQTESHVLQLCAFLKIPRQLKVVVRKSLTASVPAKLGETVPPRAIDLRVYIILTATTCEMAFSGEISDKVHKNLSKNMHAQKRPNNKGKGKSNMFVSCFTRRNTFPLSVSESPHVPVL